MKKLLLLTSAIVLLLGSAITAQNEDFEGRDILELAFFGGLTSPAGDIKDLSPTEGAESGMALGMDIGYFLTPRLIVGLNFTYTAMDINEAAGAGDLKYKLYSPNLYAKYVFSGESNFEPYVKAHVGADNPKFATLVSHPDGDRYREISYDPSFAYGAGLGFFYYTSDFSGLYLEANYHMAASSDAEAIYIGDTYQLGANITVLDVHAGVRLLIGSDE